MKIPLMVVISFQVDDPDNVIPILESIDPKNLPYFSNVVRIVVGNKDVKDTINFLERKE